MKHLLLSLMFLLQEGPAGMIEGTILSQDGTPAAGVRVAAQAVPDSATPAAGANVMVSIVQSDRSGRYRLERIPAGRYYVTAGLVDFPTYYPGVTAVAEARVVVVTGSAALTGIDFRMARPAGLRVSGRLIREEGKAPVANQRLQLRGLSTAPLVTTAADGSFEFSNVIPGQYNLTAPVDFGSATINRIQAQRVVVNDADVHLEIVVPLTATVTGQLLLEREGARPRLNLIFAGEQTRMTATLSSNGTYSVDLPLGDYQVTAQQLQPGFTLKSIVSGPTDLLKEPLKVTRDASPKLVVTLGVSDPPPWVKVSGRVTGSVAPRSTVAMTGSSAGEILEASIKDDGTFEFPRVLPGPYTARMSRPGIAPEPITLTVGNTDITNFEIVQPVTVDVPGRVTWDAGGPRTGLLGFSLRSSPGALVRRMSAPVRPNGTFNLTLPEGEFNIELSLIPDGYVVKSMSYGSANLLTDKVRISNADNSRELQITLEGRSSPTGYFISGRVTGVNPATEPAPIRMTLIGRTVSGPGETQVASNGEFSIGPNPTGSYTLRAFSVAQGIDVSKAVTVNGQDFTGLEVRFPAQRQATGRVAFENGESVQPRFWLTLTGNETVTLYATAQRNGSFTIRPPLGEWRVVVGGLAESLVLKSVTYGDANLLETPWRVTAADTQELRLTIANNAPLVRLGGRFIAPRLSGEPAAQFSGGITSIRLTGPATIEAPLRTDGSFEFPRIFPATYSWCCNFGWTSITVPNSGDSNLTIRAVKGSVVMEEGSIAAETYLRANDGNGTSAARIATDGSFFLVVPEGTYRLSMDTPAGFYVKSMRYGASEISNQTVTVVPGVEPSELQIVIARRP